MGSATWRSVQELRLDDIEAAATGFSGMQIELSPLSRPARPWSFVESRLEGVAFLAGQMGAALAARGRIERDNHWFFLPTEPPPPWTMNGMQIRDGALHLMPAGGEFLVGAARPVGWLALQVAPGAFSERRAAVAGAAEAGTFRSFRAFDAGRAALASLRRAIQAGVALVRKDPAIVCHDAVCRRLQNMMLGRLVECTLDPSAEPPPRSAAFAAGLQRYLDERGDEAVFTEDVSAALGLSDRSLRRLFAELFAMSPGRFLRRRRLHLAHRKLLANAAGRGVTDVSYEYGFFDVGRFAADYRELFGELPSATLHKAGDSLLGA